MLYGGFAGGFGDTTVDWHLGFAYEGCRWASRPFTGRPYTKYLFDMSRYASIIRYHSFATTTSSIRCICLGLLRLRVISAAWSMPVHAVLKWFLALLVLLGSLASFEFDFFFPGMRK